MYEDREDAGRKLGEALSFLNDENDVLVLGIPRGGVVVASEVARAIGAPLDVIITRKVGAPGNPELAVGAVTQEGAFVPEPDLVSRLHVPEGYLKSEVVRQGQDIDSRMKRYRGGRPNPRLEGKTIVIVDDGVATGSTVRAAIESAKLRKPKSVILAVPVGAREPMEALAKVADRIVCLSMPDFFFAIGEFYEDFDQVDDQTVEKLIERGGGKTGAMA